MEFLDAPPLPIYFTPEHEQFRSSLREFVSREITPYVTEWDEAETFPRALYERAAELGVQGLGYPEAYGGTPADVFYQIVVAEEFARSGCGGVQASLNSHSIGLPPILHAGSDELKQRIISLTTALTLEEAAACLGISPATAKCHWALARAWLFAALTDGREPPV